MTVVRIIRDGEIVEDDWLRLDATAPVPADGKIIVDHARWRAEGRALAARGDVGVAIPSGLDVDELKDALPRLALIAVSFVFIQPRPEGGRTFDGRGYSQARLLRERHGYRGEIRATGDVFRDAMRHMRRCGINAFEIKSGEDPLEALRAVADVGVVYQGAADGSVPVFRRRRGVPAERRTAS